MKGFFFFCRFLLGGVASTALDDFYLLGLSLGEIKLRKKKRQGAHRKVCVPLGGCSRVKLTGTRKLSTGAIAEDLENQPRPRTGPRRSGDGRGHAPIVDSTSKWVQQAGSESYNKIDEVPPLLPR